MYTQVNDELARAKSSLHALQHSPKLMALRELLLECGIGGGREDAADDAAAPTTATSSCSQHRVLVWNLFFFFCIFPFCFLFYVFPYAPFNMQYHHLLLLSFVFFVVLLQRPRLPLALVWKLVYLFFRMLFLFLLFFFFGFLILLLLPVAVICHVTFFFWVIIDFFSWNRYSRKWNPRWTWSSKISSSSICQACLTCAWTALWR